MEDDFLLFLEEIGQTQENMERVAMEMPAPLSRSPYELYFIADSSVHGTGVFASENVDGFIGRMWQEDCWFEAGRYLNHSPTPNCKPVWAEDVMILVGTARAGEELLVNYRDIREALNER